ncbi:hypothetical protein [Secundilactobacillus folii]|uniref:Uncharacterized protein n=1 Tax=Secundilactobacillus folii TaxID=2678357 RepID=A0A7X2XVT3_9LACO|nr:hypothetical protein [Secundilactobacillus folii]MTV81808.1 hypothetical protein [Secundilactobacillus folii]
MDNTVTKLRDLYTTTRNAIIDQPLSSKQTTAFRQQLTDLNSQQLTGLPGKLANAYTSLITANLTYTSHQLYFVLNLNHDHTTITLPISHQQLLEWSNTHSSNYQLFTRNPFMYNGLSIDETAALALL